MFKRLNESEAGRVSVSIDDQEVSVPAGETVAAAVLVHGPGPSRTTPVSDAPRAPHCMMGVCFDCLMEIDGIPNRQACQVRVADGMTVRRQHGARRLEP